MSTAERQINDDDGGGGDDDDDADDGGDGECCVEKDTTEKSGGMAFEVLLKPATADSPRLVKNGTPTDRRISLELIDKKLKDAQDRREVGAQLITFRPLGNKVK